MAKLFSELSLLPTTLAVLSDLGFDRMTPVQAATLPYFLANSDVVVEACTGSGKSLAYIIPVVERLMRAPRSWAPAEVGGVIVAPTRELARQIGSIVERFVEKAALKSVLLVGGTDVAEDVRACVAGCNVIVATPGRLLDVITRHGGSIVLKHLEVLVLDEADTLLDLGMSAAVSAILSKLPKQRRTGLFSATQTREVKALARAGLRNPTVISVSVQHAPAAQAATGAGSGSPPPDGGADLLSSAKASSALSTTQSTPKGLTNYYQLCATPLAKLAALCRFLRLRADAGDKVIIFVLTCASVDFYGRVFSLPGVRSAAGLPPDASVFPILPLHGKMVPKRRTGIYESFVAAPSGALLCTDVAARGIDVPDVDWIVQFDPPKDPSFYIHRVGRTARAGRSGSSLLLLLPKEESYLQLLALKSVPVRAWAALADGPAEAAAIPVRSDPAPAPDASVFGDAAGLGGLLCAAMQAEAVADRDVLEKGTTAFVTFVRGYCEHLLKYVFKFDALDIPSLASSFGLVKLPKVDELRGKRIEFEGVPDIDTSQVAFKDPVREAQRQARLAREFEAADRERAERDARRDKAFAEQAKIESGSAPTVKRKRQHTGVQARMFEDWEQLAREERLEKRLRLGKISRAEFKAEMSRLHHELGIDDDDGLVDAAVEAADGDVQSGVTAEPAGRADAPGAAQFSSIAGAATVPGLALGSESATDSASGAAAAAAGAEPACIAEGTRRGGNRPKPVRSRVAK